MTFNLQSATDEIGAVVHDLQTDALALCFGGHAATIVCDLEKAFTLSGAVEGDADVGGFAMADCVVAGLLRDAVEVIFVVLVADLKTWFERQITHDAVVEAEGVGQQMENADEAAILHGSWRHAVRHVADLLDG